MSRSSVVLSVVLALSVTSVADATPQIGDKAPSVKVAAWITQKPPALPGGPDAGKHVFLVEFWATWCGPCLKNIPHLAELHKKHGKEGLVIIGVSTEEPSTLREFIEKKQKMPYFVASDDEAATMTAWADDIEYIPYAFIVDRSGKVAWQGNPADDVEALDKAIRQILAGKYDIEAAKRAAVTDKEFDTLLMSLQPAYAAGNKEKVFDLLERMIKLKPAELQPYLIKREMLREFAMKDSLPEWDAEVMKAFDDDAGAMRRLAGFELDKPLGIRNAELLWHCASRADKLAEGRDAAVLDMLARVQCEFGLLDDAIRTQTRAVGLAVDDAKDAYRDVLKYYEAARRIAHGRDGKSASDADS